MIRTFAIATALGASGVASAALADSGEWRVTESTGQVQILHAGLSRVATRGGTLQSGDTLVTGKAARAVVVRGEDYLVVAPNSRFRIAPPAPSSSFVQILEDWGNVVFKIKKTGVPHFGVQTPYLAAVVKGTTFSITVTKKGSSVQVIEGAVQVSTLNGGATELVRPGMIAVVSGDNVHRLDVQGEGTRRSGAPAPASPDASDAKVSTEDSITAAIGDDGSNLGEATNGLVTGSAAPVALLASAFSARGEAGMPSALPDNPSVGGADAGDMPPVAVDAGMPSGGAAGEEKPGPIDDKGGSAPGSHGAGSGGSGSNEGSGAGNGSSGNGSATGTDSSGSGNGNDHSAHGDGKGNSGNGNGNGGGDGAGNSGKGGGRGNAQNGNGGDGGKGSGTFK